MLRTQKLENEMKKLLAVALIVVASSTLMIAQNATQGINKTQRKQIARIHQGVKSGELTKREANSLRRQQIHIQKEKKIAKMDGVVTQSERKHIKRDQKRASKNIAVKKHNRLERRNRS